MGIRTVELFAGVGGFRLGLERADSRFETVWFNQWEPGAKLQHAWSCYVDKLLQGTLPRSDTNSDIAQVPATTIPDHDLLVGGFPCQDYSVATTLDKAAGLRGKKGVLWWEIDRIVATKRPRYLLLENVDRLLRSPANQRGRDFAILLSCLSKHGYRVEWRVVNAADYGNAQRRRRVFIFAAHRDTGIGQRMASACGSADYLPLTGFFASVFPTSYEAIGPAPVAVPLPASLQDVSDDFQHHFHNAGCLVGRKFWTSAVAPAAEPQAVLGKFLEQDGVDSRFFLDPARLEDWVYAKGPKREPRQAKNGHTYLYSEGGMQFPDLPGTPARTILTSEGNRTPNRSTHVVLDPKSGEHRFLTPLEVERVMGFPDGWTDHLPERWRYFTMGNALVVPLVTRMGQGLVKWIEAHEGTRQHVSLLDRRMVAVKARAKKAPRRKA